MRTALDFQIAAQKSGCQLVRTEPVTFAGERVLSAQFQCPDASDGDPWGGPRLLEALAEQDLSDPDLASLASRVTSGADNPARMIHSYVRKRVRFRPEKRELFQAPLLTDQTGAGDCDDSERLVWALAKLSGIDARFVYFLKGPTPSHVTVQLSDPLTGEWTWAEVTIPAHYGEEPLSALKRLGRNRPDIDGRPMLMTGIPLGHSLSGLGQTGPDGHPIPDYVDLSGRFAEALVSNTKDLVIDPLDALRMLLHESGLNPSADNGVASGIFQLLNSSVPSVTGMNVAMWTSLSAESQLPFWRKFLRSVAKPSALPLTGRNLYWTNFLPATVVPDASDSYVIATSDEKYVLPDGSEHSLPGVYSQNRGLDAGQKGFITAGDMGEAILSGEREHPHIFAALAPQIQAAQGGVGTGALVSLLLGLGAAAGAYYWMRG